jgi:hypothetical protein
MTQGEGQPAARNEFHGIPQGTTKCFRVSLVALCIFNFQFSIFNFQFSIHTGLSMAIAIRAVWTNRVLPDDAG